MISGPGKDDWMYEHKAYRYAEDAGIPATHENISDIIRGMVNQTLPLSYAGSKGSNATAPIAAPNAGAELDVFGEGPSAAAPAMAASAPTAAAASPRVPNSPASAPMPTARPADPAGGVTGGPAGPSAGVPSAGGGFVPTDGGPAIGPDMPNAPVAGDTGMDPNTLMMLLGGAGVGLGGAAAYSLYKNRQPNQPNIDDMMNSTTVPPSTMRPDPANTQFEPNLRGPASPIDGPSAVMPDELPNLGPTSSLNDRPPSSVTADIGATSNATSSPDAIDARVGGGGIASPMTASGNITGTPIDMANAPMSIDDLLRPSEGLMDFNYGTASTPSHAGAGIPPSISGQDAMNPQLATSSNPLETVEGMTNNNMRATEIIIDGKRVPVVATNTADGIKYINQQGEVFSPQEGKFVPVGRMQALPDEVKRAFATAGRAIR